MCYKQAHHIVLCLLVVPSNQRAGSPEEMKKLDHQRFGERKKASATILWKHMAEKERIFLHTTERILCGKKLISTDLVNINFRPISCLKTISQNDQLLVNSQYKGSIIQSFGGVFVISQTKLLNKQSRAGEIWRLNPPVTSPWWFSLFCCVLFCCGL